MLARRQVRGRAQKLPRQHPAGPLAARPADRGQPPGHDANRAGDLTDTQKAVCRTMYISEQTNTQQLDIASAVEQ